MTQEEMIKQAKETTEAMRRHYKEMNKQTMEQTKKAEHRRRYYLECCRQAEAVEEEIVPKILELFDGYDLSVAAAKMVLATARERIGCQKLHYPIEMVES